MWFRYTPLEKKTPSVTISPGSTGLRITFEGYSLDQSPQGLYLSANTDHAILSTYDFYSKVKSLSAKFPPFKGYPIQDYEIINYNLITINFPKIPLSGCNVDFIFTNDAGYAKASNSKWFSYVTIASS